MRVSKTARESKRRMAADSALLKSGLDSAMRR